MNEIACGAEHSVAITEDGEVYAWGTGECGKLGTGDLKNVPSPTKVCILVKNSIKNSVDNVDF